VKKFYLFAAIVGAIAPYATYFGFLSAVPGASGALSLAWGTPIAAATLVDFSISCLVFWPFMFAEAKRLRMRGGITSPWFFVVANLLIGLSFALPAFLYFRESALESAQSTV
jgi:Terpene cyclase DEP1